MGLLILTAGCISWSIFVDCVGYSFFTLTGAALHGIPAFLWGWFVADINSHARRASNGPRR